MYWHPLPFPIAMLLVVMCICHLYSSRRKKLPRPPVGYDPFATKKEKNLSAMQKVVDAHKDFSAEVIPFSVNGRNRVKTFRLLDPGDEIELCAVGDDFKVYAFGEYMSDLIIPENSHIPQLFKNKISFDAYLDGRDLSFANNDQMDLASLIIFFKIDGVPPTKVNLQ